MRRRRHEGSSTGGRRTAAKRKAKLPIYYLKDATRVSDGKVLRRPSGS